MAYSIEEEDKMMAMFESIANQPIEAQRPYNEVRNPKPMMESAVFEGTKVDFSSWTEDKAKVGKAKTAPDPDLSKGNKTVKGVPAAAKGKLTETKGTDKPVTENDVVNEKKEDKQVTKLVTDDTEHEAKGEPKAKSGKFDSAAKSAASAQRSKADSNKKFSEESKKQRKIQMFKDFVKSLGVDEESKAAAEKVLKKFDQISKHIGEPGDGKVKPKLEAVGGDDGPAYSDGRVHPDAPYEDKQFVNEHEDAYDWIWSDNTDSCGRPTLYKETITQKYANDISSRFGITPDEAKRLINIFCASRAYYRDEMSNEYQRGLDGACDLTYDFYDRFAGQD